MRDNSMAGFSCQRYQESYLSREICVHFIRTLFLPSSSLLCNLELGKYKELFESEVIHPSSSLVSLVLSTVAMSKPSLAAEPSLSNEKQADFIKTDEESMTGPDNLVLHNERDILTQIISVLAVELKSWLSTANSRSFHDVPRNHQLHTWNCHGGFHPTLGVVPLFEPSISLPFSFFRFIYTS